MHIWLHGNRTANASSSLNDNSTVYMWANNTQVNSSNTTAWSLAPGDSDSSDMCSNYTNRTNCTIDTPWDNTAHVRYSVNNTNAVSGISDFVWVQIQLDIPGEVDQLGAHTGTIWIHFKSDSDS